MKDHLTPEGVRGTALLANELWGAVNAGGTVWLLTPGTDRWGKHGPAVSHLVLTRHFAPNCAECGETPDDCTCVPENFDGAPEHQWQVTTPEAVYAR